MSHHQPMPILCQFHANANIRFVPAGYIMVEKSMNSNSLGFRFPTMLMHGEETETLDLLDEFVPINLGLWCTLVDLLLQPSQFVFLCNFSFKLGSQQNQDVASCMQGKML